MIKEPTRFDKSLYAIEHNETLRDSILSRVTRYMPHMPTPKQRAFLSLPHREALYGGAAGGGKSDALLMGALQFADIPYFKAIIFRRTMTDLRLPGALLDRSHEWLNNTDARFQGSAWRFPSGAVIQFGYLDNINDKLRYQGAEFQYIAFDELTQFRQSDYLYLFSRLRRTRCDRHKKQFHSKCRMCRLLYSLSRIPLRLRAATNPGGFGHIWVKKRFNIRLRPDLFHHGRPLYAGADKSRPHVPAFVEDNPHLEQSEYIESLKELDPVTREQLLAGDWDISAEGRFKRHWCGHYERRGELITLQTPKRDADPRLKEPQFYNDVTYDTRDLTTILIIDPATSVQQGPGDEERGAKKQSWTVITAWHITPDHKLILLEASKHREESPELIRHIRRYHKKYSPAFVGLEISPISQHFYALLKRAGFPMRPFKPAGRDKVTRAIPAINRMEQGQIYFPHLTNETSDWLEDFESVIFTWTGHPEEPDDEIDCLAYAAQYVSSRANDETIIMSARERPMAI